MPLDLALKLSRTNNKSRILLGLVFRTMLSQKVPMILEIRTSSSGAPSLRQPDNPPQATNHKCTDPEACKHIIVEDLEHERPLWKLTCYSHWKNSPCDIVGDVSYEELRAAAYDDAKRGACWLYSVPTNPISGAAATVFSPTAQNSFPPSVSSFSQLGASLNTGFPGSPSVPSNNASGQPISFSNFAQSSSVFATNNVPSVNAFSFGSQQPNQSVAASLNKNTASFSNSSVIGTADNQFSATAVSTQNLSTSSIQPLAPFGVSI
ncbi:hypothetical protein DITRI_Ditri10aG0115000 [Diplodiscus trichospermus]